MLAVWWVCYLPAKLWALSGPFHQFISDTWGHREGLPEGAVLSLYEDPTGILWLGTECCLLRFDGHQFEPVEREVEHFGQFSFVRALAPDSNGGFWMATVGGVGHFTGSEFEWFGPAQGLTHPFVYAIANTDVLWVGTGGDGMWQLNRGQFDRDTGFGDALPGNVNAIALGPDGLWWAATDFGLIKRSASGRWENHTFANGQTLTGIKALHLDQSNTLWVAGEHGVGAITKGGQLQLIDALANAPVYSLLQDSQGNLWAGGIDQVARIKGKDINLHLHSLGRTHALLEDSHGNIWLGTNRGLLRLKHGAIATATTHDGLPQNSLLTVLNHPAGGLWVTDSQGRLGHWQDNHYQKVAGPGATPGGGMLGMTLDHEGALWVANGNLSRWHQGQTETFTLPQSDATLIESSEGGLWLGQTRANGESSVRFIPEAAINQGQIQQALESANPLPIDLPMRHLQRIYRDNQDNLWLATGGTGLIRYHIPSGQARRFDEQDGLPSAYVYGVIDDGDQQLWVATRAGLALIKDDQVTHFKAVAGLPERSPVHIALDPQQRLWVSADDGLYVIDRQSLLNPSAHPKVRKLTTRDGLHSLVVSWRRSGMAISGDTLYFATTEGLAIAKSSQVTLDTPAPTVTITEVTLGGEHHNKPSVIIHNRQAHLDISYRTPDLNTAHRLEFQSRLIEKQQTRHAPWSAPSTQRSVQFSNLAHGSYRFEVRARYNGEPWAADSASLVIEVPPHLYERSVVQIAIIVIGLLIMAYWVRRRLNAAERIEYELRQRVAERTAELKLEIDYRIAAEKSASDLAQNLDQRVREQTAQLELAEMATKRSEERFALAVKGAEDGIWDWDISINQLYLSPRWISILGYQRDGFETSISHWLSEVHPDDVETLRDILIFASNDSSFRLEYRMRHCKGHDIWVLTRGVVVRDEDGTPIRAAGSHTDISARKAAEQHLLHRQMEDPVTGLPNRVLFTDRLNQAVLHSHETHSAFAVILVDIDHFRAINERFGQASGDEVLKTYAHRIKQSLRAIDTVARVGNDEFAILIHDIKHDQDTEQFANHLKQKLSTPLTIKGETLSIQCSMGIKIGKPDQTFNRDFLMASEQALTQAKQSEITASNTQNDREPKAPKHLTQEFEQGIAEQHFVLFYQPLINPSDQTLVGVEALARWQHPTRGLLSPYHFIGMLETCNLMAPFSEWVLKAACQQGRLWQEQYGLDINLSINIPAHQFNDNQLTDLVIQTLKDEQLPAKQLCLEIVENNLLSSQPVVFNNLKKLRSLGVKIAIDDFGTGYSALSYLGQFPIDRVKIDRSFCQNVPNNDKANAMLSALVNMINELGLEIVVEGIETQPQRDFLLSLGSPIIQGYFYSEPIAGNEYETLFRQYGLI